MDLVLPHEGGGTAPIGIESYNADPSTQIRGNCVSNTNFAIYVWSDFFENLPLIANNFMYNYVFSGVYSWQSSGNIGSGPGFTKAGRNTFASNNVTAADIYADFGVTITEAGNYGDFVFGGTGLITSAGTRNLYFSSASCAKQTAAKPTPDAVIDSIAICDHYPQLLYPYLTQSTGDTFSLSSVYEPSLATMRGNPAALRQMSSVLSVIVNKGNMSAATNFYNAVGKANVLSGNDALWFNYLYAYVSGDFKKASGILTTISPATENESDHKQVEQVKLGLQLHATDVKMLSKNDKATLTVIDNRRGTYAAQARDLLQMNNAQHDFIFGKPIIPATKVDLTHTINRVDEYMELFPNPANDRITVRYNIQDVANHSLRVLNELGQEVKDVTLMYNGADIQLDISHLSLGMYIIFIQDGNSNHSASFVKN